MRTQDSNGLQIKECCRNRRSGQLSAGAGLARQDAPDSELSRILDLGVSTSTASPRGRVLGALYINVETDSTATIGMDSRKNVEGPDTKVLECSDKTLLDVDKELEILQFNIDCNIRSSQCGEKSTTPLEVALSASVKDKSDTDLRIIVTGGVASVMNLIVYAHTFVCAKIEVRPDKERNSLGQVRRLNTVAPTKGIRS